MSAETQYLLALYILAHRRSPPLQTSEVATFLDRSQSTVTEMFQRLDDDGLVTYEPYEGVSLTESGRERAANLHETYVTVSWFFRDALDLESPEQEAMKLADTLDPSVAERLAAELPYEADAPTALEDDGQQTVPDDP